MTDTKVWQYFVYAATQSILKVTVFFVVEVGGYLYSIENFDYASWWYLDGQTFFSNG